MKFAMKALAVTFFTTSVFLCSSITVDAIADFPALKKLFLALYGISLLANAAVFAYHAYLIEGGEPDER